MAKIVEGNPVWKATIRCAQARCGGTYRVDGCFAVIEIEASDLKSYTDSDGDTTLSCKCPSCKITLYPRWQLASLPGGF